MRRSDSINFAYGEALQSGILERGPHRIQWATSGNPEGIPVIMSHGGPGGQNREFYRSMFDPQKWYVVQIDQRGNGVSEPAGEIRENTTALLLQDMEDVRELLGIEQWLVAGGSWGSTLSITYAETWPERSLGLLVFCMWLGQHDIFDFWWHAGEWTFPECYAELIEGFSRDERGDIQGTLISRVLNGSPEVAAEAARRLMEFENVLMYFNAPILQSAGYSADVYSRIFAHYMSHHCFLRPNQLIEDANRLGAMPVKIVQGRYDMCTPPKYAFDFKAAVPHADLRIVDNASHMPLERDFLREIVRAAKDLHRELQTNPTRKPA